MIKKLLCISMTAIMLSSYNVTAANINTNIDTISIDDIQKYIDGEVIEVLDLKENNEGIILNYDPRSVPTKVTATSTSYVTEHSKIIAKSPIVSKGMTATVSYSKGLSASLNCNFGVSTSKVSSAVGFTVNATYSTSGSASQVAKRRGYVALVPRYKIVNFNVYIKPRRSGRKAKWILVSRGSAKKPESLIAVWKNA